MSIRILIVDDEKIIRESLAGVLIEEGHSVDQCENGEQAMDRLEQLHYDLVITDIQMPEMDGMELLGTVRNRYPETFVMIMTAFASIETAVQALRAGAYDYLIKPLDFEDVIFRIQRLVTHRQFALENQLLRQELNTVFNFSNIIGSSAGMIKVFETIKKVAATDSTVLITGRSGTGKELVARAIHYNGLRKSGRFVPVNCGAIVETLMESELFGHKKGAFTGAIRDKDGLFKVATSGTLFLDEISEMPLHLQAKLLRALEQKEITPVGGTEPVKIDVRFLAATNRTLADEVEKGRFRKDLFYRLNVVEIHIPSLTSRRDDIPLLIRHFIDRYSREMNKPVKGVDNAAMRALMQHEWKGEIRELENVIERAIIFCDGEFISPNHLPGNIVPETNQAIRGTALTLKDALKQYERQHILQELERNKYNREKTAEQLGISVSSLYRKMDELGIELK